MRAAVLLRPRGPARRGRPRARRRGARRGRGGHDLRHRREDVAPRASRAAAYPCALRPRDGRACAPTTGERVLVADSVACGGARRAGPGGRRSAATRAGCSAASRERIAAPAAALHAIPDGLPPAAAAMAEPLAAAIHAVARAASAAEDVGVLGGGPMGLMLASLLVARGPTVTLADRHPERRAQAEALGARARERLERHALVFEAVGRPGGLARGRRGGRAGRRRGARRRLPARHRRRTSRRPAPLRRARPPRRVPPLPRRGRPRAGAARRRARSTGRVCAGEPIGLDELPAALALAVRRPGAQVGRGPARR